MTVGDSILLGAIQGLTEFIPISSSGHLIIARDLFGIQGEFGLAFDAVLHFATAIAVLVYFRHTFWNLLCAVAQVIMGKMISNEDRTMIRALIIGTFPVVVVGLLFREHIEGLFRTSGWVALMLLIGSLIFWCGERSLQKRTMTKPLSLHTSLTVGLFQILALLPGMSRSGVTIAAGMLTGLSRTDAARFSFLLSFPVVLGAGIFGLMNMSTAESLYMAPLISGALTSFIVGLVAIHTLLSFVRNHTFTVFIVYRILLALVILISVM